MRIPLWIITLLVLALGFAGAGIYRVAALRSQPPIRTAPPADGDPANEYEPSIQGTAWAAKDAKLNQNSVLPCGHKWARLIPPGGFLGNMSEPEDECTEGHRFVRRQGVWMPSSQGG